MLVKLFKISILSLVIFSFQTMSAQAALTCHVSAACTGSEINVLELTDTTNAHAGLPGAGYPYAVCCSGATGLSTSCSQNKVFAKLSDATNAHVRLNSEADYPGSNNACLSISEGTLTIGNQDNNCNGYDTTIISLAKVPTNSHVGEEGAYIHKVCGSYKAPSSGGGGGGWIPNFFGGGTGSIIPEPTPIVSPISTILPTPTPIFTLDQSAGDDNSFIEIVSEVPAQVAINDQTVSQEGQTQPNLQIAAVSGLSGLITSTGFKVVSILVILAMIFLARRFYLKQK